MNLPTATARLRELLSREQERKAQDTVRMLELIEDLHRSEQQRYALAAQALGQEQELRELKARLAVYEAKAAGQSSAA